MDINSIIMLVVAIIIVYLVIKFIVNPLVKIVSGIVVLLAAIYVIQNFFQINLSDYLGPLGEYIDLAKINSIIDWLFGLVKPLFQK